VTDSFRVAEGASVEAAGLDACPEPGPEERR
jgi:hypothetical protein